MLPYWLRRRSSAPASGGPGDLDIAVDDLAAAPARAVALGAIEAAFQPQDDVRVMLDPDGHPFCLFEVS
jgi:hypothetical protein